MCRSDTEVVEKALERYEIIMGAKINRNKFSGLRLGAWKGVDILGHFSFTYEPIRILGAWLGPRLQLKKNWS